MSGETKEFRSVNCKAKLNLFVKIPKDTKLGDLSLSLSLSLSLWMVCGPNIILKKQYCLWKPAWEENWRVLFNFAFEVVKIFFQIKTGDLECWVWRARWWFHRFTGPEGRPPTWYLWHRVSNENLYIDATCAYYEMFRSWYNGSWLFILSLVVIFFMLYSI